MKFSKADPNSRYAKAIHEAASLAATTIVRRSLERHEGNLVAAAEWLGITLSQLYRCIDDLGLGAHLDRARRTAALPPGKSRMGRPPIPRANRPPSDPFDPR